MQPEDYHEYTEREMSPRRDASGRVPPVTLDTIDDGDYDDDDYRDSGSDYDAHWIF